MDNVQKETHVVAVMTNLHKETCAVVRGKKDDRLLLHQARRPRLTKGEKNPQKQATNEALQTRGATFRAVARIVKIRHVDFGHPPVCHDYKSETGCIKRRKCFFRHVEAEEKPSKKVKERWCERISCIIKGVYTTGLCISRFLSEKVCST